MNFPDDPEIQFRIPPQDTSTMSAPARNLETPEYVPRRKTRSLPGTRGNTPASRGDTSDDSEEEDFHDSYTQFSHGG